MKIMASCVDVFTCWDDEYDKFQVLLRDIMKRKRDEHLKMVWRITPAHKKLQARLEQMRKYEVNFVFAKTLFGQVLFSTKISSSTRTTSNGHRSCFASGHGSTRRDPRRRKNENDARN